MKLSIIFPVYKDGELIDRAISHIKSIASDFDYELIFSVAENDDPLRHSSAENIKIISAPKGRASQMNAGAAVASGDVLLFLHIDTRLPETAFFDIQKTIEDKGFSVGAFSLKFASKRISLKLIAAITTIRSKLNKMPYGDQSIFIKRDVFNALGGFFDEPLLEDVLLMELIKRAGLKVRILSSVVITSARKYELNGIWKTVYSNRKIIFLFKMGVSIKTLARMYYRRKLNE